MYALNHTWEHAGDDGLEPLAPFHPATHGNTARRAIHGAWAPAGGATAGVLIAVLFLLTRPFASTLVLAMGGTAAFVYLGTALVSGRPGAASLDLGAALTAFGVALAAVGPAVSALLVHVVWGILRGASHGTAPGRSFAAAWAALHATAALLLGFGA